MSWDEMNLQNKLLLLKYARLLLQNKASVGLALNILNKNLCVSQIPESVLTEIENTIGEK